MAIGAALPFLIQGGSTLLNNIFGGIAARRERKFAQQNWQQQNAYNSPSATMARYRAAGMNPGYAGQMNFANAQPVSESANKTHAVEVPNQLDTLREYFSLKNAELENSRLSELLEQEKINTSQRKQLQDEELNSKLSRYGMDNYNELLRFMEYKQKGEMYDKNMNPYKQDYEQSQGRYQLESARGKREKDIFDNFTGPMNKLDLDWRQLVISPNDNIFARLLARIFADRIPKGSSILNYFK